MEDKKWFTVVYQFRHNGADHIEEVESYTTSQKSAQGSTWANLLRRFPGAIYVAHSFDGGVSWVGHK